MKEAALTLTECNFSFCIQRAIEMAEAANELPRGFSAIYGYAGEEAKQWAHEQATSALKEAGELIQGVAVIHARSAVADYVESLRDMGYAGPAADADIVRVTARAAAHKEIAT